MLEFTSDGRILWKGEFVDNCCKSNKYTLKNEKNILITVAEKDCEKTGCFPCSTWGILKLTEKTLEIETCEVASRYEKAN
jgi:hypothetical protein